MYITCSPLLLFVGLLLWFVDIMSFWVELGVYLPAVCHFGAKFPLFAGEWFIPSALLMRPSGPNTKNEKLLSG